MIYLFPKIYKCTVNFYIRKRTWDSYQHGRNLCYWRQVIPVYRYIWRSVNNAETYTSRYGERSLSWFYGWKDRSVFKLVGRHYKADNYK
jgi:hypothetical protein